MSAAVAIVVLLLAVDPGSAPDPMLDAGYWREPLPVDGGGPVTDGGFALGAGEHGVVVDRSVADGGASKGVMTHAEHVELKITGARVLPPEVYREALHLDSFARADEETARAVHDQLLDYLQRAGFELAQVQTRVEDGAIAVELDEGRIERVVYVGPLSFQQLQFKLALLLPGDVFNRPLVDEQVRALAQKLNLPGVRWELVRTSLVVHHGPQATKLPGPADVEFFGDRVIHERRPFEVRVVFPELTGSGLGIDVRSSYLDGLELGVNDRLRHLLFDQDQLWSDASVGVAARERLDTYRLYPHVAKVAAMGRYDTPLLLGHLRPNLWLQGEWLTRQRRDLGVENYNALIFDLAAQVALEARPGLQFQLGAGLEWRRLFGFELDEGVPASPVARLFDRKRPFLRITHESVFDPEVLRWDRRHTFETELRFYPSLAGDLPYGWATARYQYVHAFGWHDLWIKGRGFVSWGDVSFHDEVSVGDFLRSLFGSQYVRAGNSLQLEFRFSVVRDLFKISLFHDLAVFAVQPDRTQPKLLAQLADGFGPGLHFLIAEMFQVDMYAAFGFRRLGQFNFGLALQIDKAF